jgi:hypothetical protein
MEASRHIAYVQERNVLFLVTITIDLVVFLEICKK